MAELPDLRLRATDAVTAKLPGVPRALHVFEVDTGSARLWTIAPHLGEAVRQVATQGFGYESREAYLADEEAPTVRRVPPNEMLVMRIDSPVTCEREGLPEAAQIVAHARATAAQWVEASGAGLLMSTQW